MIRLVTVLLLLAASTPDVAHAQAIRVDRIRGRGGARIRTALVRGLERAGVDVDASASVALRGRVTRRRRRYVLRLRLSGSGESQSLRVRGRRTGQLVRAAVERVVAVLGDLGDGGSVISIEPVVISAAETDPERVAPALERPATLARGDWAGEDVIELAVGADWMARYLSFTDDIFDRLGEYGLPAALVVNASARWFPARHWTSHPLAGLGVEGQVFGALGLRSAVAGRDDNGGTSATTVDAWRASLIYRLRLADPVSIEGMFGGGVSRFRVDPSGPRGPSSDFGFDAVPAAVYRYLRPAVALSVDLFEGISVRGSVGWRGVLQAGQLSDLDWFPRSFTTGVDVSLQVTWRFDRWFALRVHATHVRYLTDLMPEVGDVRVAGGATDEWTRAGAEFVVVLPGVR